MLFCVEDDTSIRDLMIYALNSAGFQVMGLQDGKELTEALKTEQPELILLDIMLPGEDGVSILKKLKANPVTEDIPVILATAKGTEFDKVVGLDNGADDYLAKPFGMMEMISRVKAVLRRTKPKVKQTNLRVGDIEVDLQQHIVTVNGQRLELTLKEFELLELFMTNVGIAFTRDQLLNKIWGMDYAGESRTVDVHIGTLRAKLGDCANSIKTVRGVGYRMEW